MENPTLGIRCRIVARIPVGIHRFEGNSHKIRSDPSQSGRRIKFPGQDTQRCHSEQCSIVSPKK